MSGMKSYINTNIDKIIKRTSEHTAHMLDERMKRVEYLEAKIDNLELQVADSLKKVTESLDKQLKLSQVSQEIIKAHYQDIGMLRNRLILLRDSDDYKKTFTNKQPLISIRIATYNRAQTLIDKAIASILKQTYQNFEVVIVGDHCTDDTEQKIKQLNDSRIRFYNLYNRSIYPEDRIDKWQVIGALPMNIASSLCAGEWIAPIDDDDEFSEDHLEVLLTHALETKSELVYGAMIQRNLVDNTVVKVWSSSPEMGKISLNGAMYMRVLNSVYQYDQYSWVMDEPGDWNMCRRMIESGVNVSGIDHPVGFLNMIPAGSEKKDY